MSAELIRQEIEKIRKVVEAASEGPWGVDHGMKYTTGKTCEWQHVIGARGRAICNTSAFEEVKVGDVTYVHARNGKMEDAQFIAQAREALPQALEALEALAAALEKVADPRKRDHKEPDAQTEVYCLNNIAEEALSTAASILGRRA